MVDIAEAFMRGLEKPLILWLISQRPRHGYELIKEVKRLTGQKLKPGVLYPLLYELEDEGFLASEWLRRGQQELKRYHLTEKGKTLLLRICDFFGNRIKGMFDYLLSENGKE